jgi:hypothetical protein
MLIAPIAIDVWWEWGPLVPVEKLSRRLASSITLLIVPIDSVRGLINWASPACWLAGSPSPLPLAERRVVEDGFFSIEVKVVETVVVPLLEGEPDLSNALTAGLRLADDAMDGARLEEREALRALGTGLERGFNSGWKDDGCLRGAEDDARGRLARNAGRADSDGLNSGACSICSPSISESKWRGE